MRWDYAPLDINPIISWSRGIIIIIIIINIIIIIIIIFFPSVDAHYMDC